MTVHDNKDHNVPASCYGEDVEAVLISEEQLAARIRDALEQQGLLYRKE